MNPSSDLCVRSKIKEIALYKTEYCRNWIELGHCRYGKKCRYAHGDAELRVVPRHNRYKTQICRAYHLDGTCPYGIRCTFIHDITESSLAIPSSLSLPVPSSPGMTNRLPPLPPLPTNSLSTPSFYSSNVTASSPSSSPVSAAASSIWPSKLGLTANHSVHRRSSLGSASSSSGSSLADELDYSAIRLSVAGPKPSLFLRSYDRALWMF